METLKLLIADSSEEFLAALSGELHGLYRLRTCADGKSALDQVKSFRPDILVVDLMLPGLDGISLLQSVHDQGFHPAVLAVTRFTSDYVSAALERLCVSYVMQKPCDISAMVSRIRDISQTRPVSVTSHSDPAATVSNQLLMLGIPTKLNGFQYLRLAVPSMAHDPNQSITKELYPNIAAQCGGSADQVERCIRSAIRAAWEKRNAEVWDRFFPNRTRLRPPSNGEFISALAQRLPLQSEELFLQAQ